MGALRSERLCAPVTKMNASEPNQPHSANSRHASHWWFVAVGVAAVADAERWATMRLCTFWFFWMMGVCSGACQYVQPPQFDPYTGPTIAYPEEPVGFTMYAHSFQTDKFITYDLLAAPTNVILITVSGRPPEVDALIQWQTPPPATVGTTNVFIIRATDQGTPPLSATSTVSFVLLDLPPIQSIRISNGAPTLQFSNPIPGQSYLVLRSADLSATNWSTLCATSGSPLIAVTDTNALVPQCFFRLALQGGWCYGGSCP